jgi:hypothetical protein
MGDHAAVPAAGFHMEVVDRQHASDETETRARVDRAGSLGRGGVSWTQAVAVVGDGPRFGLTPTGRPDRSNWRSS